MLRERGAHGHGGFDGGTAAFQDPALALLAPQIGGSPDGAASFSQTSTYTYYYLTTGIDTLNLTTPCNVVYGTFGYVTPGGAETDGTFSVGDYIDGGAGNSTTLSVYQNNPNNPYGTTFDEMPLGVTIKNVQEFDINSVQALGIATEYFDTTGVDGGGLAFLDVQAVLGSNFIKASAVTNVSVTDFGGLYGPGGAIQGGNVNILGGNNINVSTTGVAGTPASVVTIGSASNPRLDPTGTISVINTDQTAGSDIITYGGTAVSASGYAAININNPAGNVAVSELGTQAADTVSIVGGNNINVASSGGSVSVLGAAGTVNVTETNYGAGVLVDGGTNITVNAFGPVSVLDETGTVNISATSVTELGGTDVTVNATGAVKIGQGILVGPNQPTGTVTVTDTGSGSPVTVYGGKEVNVTAAGQISVEKLWGSGPVSITETNQATVAGGITAYGGQTVTINSQGGAFSNGIFGANKTAITVGVPVKVITRQNGTQYIAHTNEDPSGNVTINDTTSQGGQLGYGAGVIDVTTRGAKTVSVTGGTAGGITDIQAIALVRNPGGNPTPGVSTLATVFLDGVAGTETITTDALTSLTMNDSGAANTAGVLKTVVSDRTAHSLALGLNNDAGGTALSDNTATNLAITLGNAASALAITAQAETSMSITGNAVLYLTGAAGQAKLQSITLSGNAGLNDGGAGSGLANYAALASIDGSHTSGALTVALNQYQTFTGGSGLDTVTLSHDALARVYGGSGTSNVLVVNGPGTAFTAANTGANVSGFSELRTTNLSSGSYDLRGTFNNITNVDVAQTPSGPLTFLNTGTTQILSIEQSLGASAVSLVLPSGTNGPASLAMSLGTATSAGIDTSNNGGGSTLGNQLLGAQGYTSVAIASNGGTNSQTGQSLGTNFTNLGDTAITSLTVTGDENLTIGSTGNQLSTIDTTGALASATIDLRSLGIAAGGVTLTAGAATIMFTGNVQSLKTDYVTFTAGNNGANQIVEKGTGALEVNGSLANGNNTITSNAGVLLATLGNGNNVVNGSDATTTITAGNGNNTINIGKSAQGTLASMVTVGSGENSIKIAGNGNDTLFIGTLTTDGRTAGGATVTLANGNDAITAGAGAYNIQLGTGADTVIANVGATHAGGVTLSFSADSTASDTFTLGDGNNIISGTGVLSDGNNTVEAGNGANTLIFGNGSNSIVAGNGGNVISAGNGNNHITTGAGNDMIVVGKGNNNITTGNGNDFVMVGSGANNVTLGDGTDTVALAPNAGPNIFTSLSGVVANDTLQFLGTNGTGTFTNGSAANCEVVLPPNATFADYLNAATFGDGSINSEFAWFVYQGNEYLVEDSSAASTYVAGVDTVVRLSGESLNLNHMTLDPTGHNITFHN